MWKRMLSILHDVWENSFFGGGFDTSKTNGVVGVITMDTKIGEHVFTCKCGRKYHLEARLRPRNSAEKEEGK